MGIRTEISCDSCGNQLNDGGSYQTYRIHLHSEQMPLSGNVVYDMFILPPIKEDKYFCWLKCLHDWVQKNASKEE